MMFKLLLLINFLFVNSFVRLNLSKINKYKINMFTYNEFDKNKSTYTIIANYDEQINILLYDLMLHKVNYIFIDKEYYTNNELMQISKYYLIDDSVNNFEQTLVFFEDKKYIGGNFELYEVMQYY
jgi:hypothetical protein